jgi:L-asparaginase II
MIAQAVEGVPYVAVTRGGYVESLHRIAACALDGEGSTLLSIGEPEAPVFMRSAAKPFIAAALVRAGVAQRFGWKPCEIAIVAGSHDGTEMHVAAVRSILAKAGVSEGALRCGAHVPYSAAAAERLERLGVRAQPVHNNCSGKHAGILALCAAMEVPAAGYTLGDHPAQKLILDFCARASDLRADQLMLAVDGCDIPAYAIALRRAALAVSRLATLRGLPEEDAAALRVVRDAMIACPEYVAGDGDFDTELMRAAPGAVVAKSGAEGVHATAAIDAGVGMVVKVADGASRAVPPAVVALLRERGLVGPQALARLKRYAEPVLCNRSGHAVGTLTPIAR